jgi:hypothetical protein
MDSPEARSGGHWRGLIELVRSRLKQDKKGAYIGLICLLLLGLMEYMRALSPFISDSSRPMLVGLAPLASDGVYAHAGASEMALSKVSS